MRRRLLSIGVVAVLVLAAGACQGNQAPPLDCTSWRYGAADEPAPGVLPTEYDRDHYELTSRRDTSGGLGTSLHDQCGQKGAAVDLAWGVTKGRDDVRIAVLDSGIEWRDPGAMADLATTAYVNLGEARPGCGRADGDCNGDGAFDITDFGTVTDRNGNGLADPEDLILDPAYSDGVDNDGNGYVDDISGWDFLHGDNDPLDTVEYGHGTGEATDSVAAANGTGAVGTCPDCRHIPVRVGDSFIADGGRFAAGVLFALDSGADVVQEALGAISNPTQAQQAIDAAYARGVVVVASMADEASEHPNLPGSLEHTMAVNSITQREDAVSGEVDGYLAVNGCTNYGGHAWVSVPSSSCSSGATGLGSGMVGLLESEARQAGIAPYPGLGGRGGNVLSANEAMQVVRAYADDVDFSTPTATDPANDYGLPDTAGIIDNERYPTRKGWDLYHGYGRINAYEIVRHVRDGKIPPEADLVAPQWFDLLPTSGTVPITGTVAARFASSFDWRVEWAAGAQPPAHPAADTWHVVAGEDGRTTPRSGTLGSLDLAAVAAALPDGGTGASVGADGRPDGDRFAARVRIVVTAHGGTTEGLTGESQKQVFVHDDPDLRPGYPTRVPGASSASPVFADLGGPAGDELVVATNDGTVHAFTASGAELPGWPVQTSVAPWWPVRSRTASLAGIAPAHSAIVMGAPAIADIDGDQSPDVVATDIDGHIWAWRASGERMPGFGADGRPSGTAATPAYSTDSVTAQDPNNRTQPGFVGGAALGNLDSDPELEIVAASLDRHVYAFEHDGTPVPGFPVLLADPAKVAAVDPTTHRITFAAGSGITQSGGMVATPTLHDFTGDGRAEIVVGAQESYQETPDVSGPFSLDSLLDLLGLSGNARLYMISPDGRGASNPDRSAAHPDDQAYVPGWPTKMAQIQLNALPVIGDGVATQAVAANLVAGGGHEIVAQTAGGPTYVLKADGTSAYGTTNGRKNTAAWAAGAFYEGADRFGANRNSSDIIVSAAAFSGPALGRIDSDGVPEIATPTAGLTRLLDILLPDRQPPSHDQLTVYRPNDGGALPGFPQETTDLAFFVTPAVADVDGNGRNEAIAGNGVYTLSAHEADGRRPDGWAKLTGGWVVGTPGLGDLDGDGALEMAVVRRDGVLLVWDTADRTPGPGEWRRFGGNGRNTGVYRG